MLHWTANKQVQRDLQHSSSPVTGQNVFSESNGSFDEPFVVSIWPNLWNIEGNSESNLAFSPDTNHKPNPSTYQEKGCQQYTLANRNIHGVNTVHGELAVCQNAGNPAQPSTHSRNPQYSNGTIDSPVRGVPLPQNNNNILYGQYANSKRPATLQVQPTLLAHDESTATVTSGKDAVAGHSNVHNQSLPNQIMNTFQIQPNDKLLCAQQSNVVYCDGQQNIPRRMDVSLHPQHGNSQANIGYQTENVIASPCLLQLPADRIVGSPGNASQACPEGPQSTQQAPTKGTPGLHCQMVNGHYSTGYHHKAVLGTNPSYTCAEIIGMGKNVESGSAQSAFPPAYVNIATHCQPISFPGALTKSNKKNDPYYRQAINAPHGHYGQTNSVSHSYDQRDITNCGQASTENVSLNKKGRVPSQIIGRWHAPRIENPQSHTNSSRQSLVNEEQCGQANSTSNIKTGNATPNKATSTICSQLINVPSSFHGALSAIGTGPHIDLVPRETDAHSALAAKKASNESTLTSKQTVYLGGFVQNEALHVGALLPRQESAHQRVQVPRVGDHQRPLVPRQAGCHCILVPRGTDRPCSLLPRLPGNQAVLVPIEINQLNTVLPRQANHHGALVSRETDHHSPLVHRQADQHGALVSRETDHHNPLVPRQADNHGVFVPRETDHHNPLVPRQADNHGVLAPRETDHLNPLVPQKIGHHGVFVPRETNQHKTVLPRQVVHHNAFGHKCADYHSAAVARATGHEKALMPNKTGHHNILVPPETNNHNTSVPIDIDHSSKISSTNALALKRVRSSRSSGLTSSAVADHSLVVPDPCLDSNRQSAAHKGTHGQSSKDIIEETTYPFPGSVFNDISGEKNSSVDLVVKNNPKLMALFEKPANEVAPSKIPSEIQNSQNSEASHGLASGKNGSSNSTANIVQVIRIRKNQNPICEGVSSKDMPIYDILIDDTELYKCGLCDGLVLDSPSSLIFHLRVVHNHTEYLPCPHCHVVLDRYRLIRHLELRHRRSKAPRFFCGGIISGQWKCYASFDSLYNLWVHLNEMHVEQTAIHCEQCEMTFESKRKYVLHCRSVLTVKRMPKKALKDSPPTSDFAINNCGRGKTIAQKENEAVRYDRQKKSAVLDKLCNYDTQEQENESNNFTAKPNNNSHDSENYEECKNNQVLEKEIPTSKKRKNNNQYFVKEIPTSKKRKNNNQDFVKEITTSKKRNKNNQDFEKELPTSKKCNKSNQNFEKEISEGGKKINQKYDEGHCEIFSKQKTDKADFGNEQLVKITQNYRYEERRNPETKKQTKVSQPGPSFQGYHDSGGNGSLYNGNNVNENVSKTRQLRGRMDIPREGKLNRIHGVLIKEIPKMDDSVETITASHVLGMTDVLDNLLMMKRRERKLQCGDSDKKKIQVGAPRQTFKQRISRYLRTSRKKRHLQTRSKARKCFLQTPVSPLVLKSESWKDFLSRNDDVFDDETSEQLSDVKAKPYPDHQSEEDTKTKMKYVAEIDVENIVQQAVPSAKEAVPIHLDDLHYTCCFCSLTYKSIMLFRLHLTCHATATTSVARAGFASRFQKCGLCDARLDLKSSETLATNASSCETHSSYVKNSSISTRSNCHPYSSIKTERFDDQISGKCPRKVVSSYRSDTHYHCNGIKSVDSFARSLHFYGGMAVSLYPSVQMCRDNPLMCTK